MARERKVGLMGMIVMGFFWVCGGMYGNEELLQAGPPLYVLTALAVVPLIHSLPVSLMIAECATAWPVDGGLAVFVQRAFGPTIGGYNTFFTWLNCLVDASIYPLMAAMYTEEVAHVLGCARYFDSQIFCMVIVAAMTAMQLRGLDWMVRFSTLLLVLSLAPTVLFTALGAPQLRPPVLLRRDGPVEWPLLVSFVFWLDSARRAILGAQFSARNSRRAIRRTSPTAAPSPPQGFYSLADIAGEVDNPRRVFPLTVAVLEPTNALVNLLPLAVALSIDPNPRHYEVSYFSTLASRLAGGCEGRRSGGCWFGHLFFFAAMVSNLGNYNSQVVTAEKLVGFFLESQLLGGKAGGGGGGGGKAGGGGGGCRRLPFFRYLFTWSEAAGQYPAVIVFNACCIAALIVLFPLDVLIELVAFIMTINMSLFLLAFLQLRRAEPDAPRPFRLPCGWAGALVAAAFPLAFITLNLLMLLLDKENGLPRVAFFAATVGFGSIVQLVYGRLLRPADHVMYSPQAVDQHDGAEHVRNGGGGGSTPRRGRRRGGGGRVGGAVVPVTCAVDSDEEVERVAAAAMNGGAHEANGKHEPAAAASPRAERSESLGRLKVKAAGKRGARPRETLPDILGEVASSRWPY